MPRKKSNAPPSLTRHAPSGQGRVRLNGHDHYLGPWPDGLDDPPPAVRAAYDRLIADWLAAGRRLPDEAPASPPGTNGNGKGAGLTVAELVARFWEHAEGYYRGPDGSPTSEVSEFRYSLRPLNFLVGALPAADFGPLALGEVRDLMVKGYVHPEYGEQAALARSLVNHRVRRIVRAFKWGVSKELVPPPVHQALKTVEGLKKGRCEAKESEPVLPVEVSLVEKTLPHLLAPVAAMVRLQLLTGMRPGEACVLRPCDLDTTGPVWLYRPPQHKTAHKGKPRVVAIGPKAQEVLRPYLPARCPLCGSEGRRKALGWRDTLCGPCADRMEEEGICGPWPAVRPSEALVKAHLFSPKEGMEERARERRARRKTKVPPSQMNRRKKAPRKKAGERYRRSSYTSVIAQACERAGLAGWHPNQLRHTHGTEVRKRYGLEAAQVALGHSKANVTEVYAERDLSLAVRVAREIG